MHGKAPGRPQERRTARAATPAIPQAPNDARRGSQGPWMGSRNALLTRHAPGNELPPAIESPPKDMTLGIFKRGEGGKGLPLSRSSFQPGPRAAHGRRSTRPGMKSHPTRHAPAANQPPSPGTMPRNIKGLELTLPIGQSQKKVSIKFPLQVPFKGLQKS
jgi:hypothetical protein